MRTKQPSGRKMWYFSITFHWIGCHLKSEMRKPHRQSRNDFQADLQWNDVETLRPQQFCAIHTNQVKNELHFMKIFIEFCNNFVRSWARFLRWMTKNGFGNFQVEFSVSNSRCLSRDKISLENAKSTLYIVTDVFIKRFNVDANQ